MKIKLKLFSIFLVVSGVSIIYSYIIYGFANIKNFSLQEENRIHKIIENSEVYFDISYETEAGKLSKVYVECINKYILDENSKFSIHYDSQCLALSSFRRKVYAQNVTDVKIIDQSNAPAASYSGTVSWYNTFNIIGCNITKVVIFFDVISPDMDLSDIVESISLEY